MRIRFWLGVLSLSSFFLYACQLPAAVQDIFLQKPTIPRGGSIALSFPDALSSLQPWHVTSRTEEAFVTLTHAGLTRLDRQGIPQLELMDRWSASSDGTVVTATIKPDLQWSDATPLTSADVVYTYVSYRAFSPRTPLLRELQRITDVVNVDAQTVVFHLNVEYAPLLTLWALPILPMHVLGSQPIESLNLVTLATSAGPFVYTEQDATGNYHLHANPHYVRGMPFLDDVVILPKQNQTKAIAGITDASVTVAELTENTNLRTAEATKRAAVVQNELMALVFNVRDGHLFADPALRRALHQATHFEKVFDTASIESYQNVNTMAIPGHPFAVSMPISTTTDLQPMLSDAGWEWDAPSRKFLRESEQFVVRLGIDQSNPQAMRMGESLALQWRGLGLTVDIISLDRQSYLNQFIPPFAYDVALVRWANGRSDSQYADTFMYDGRSGDLFDHVLMNSGMPDIRPSLNLTGYNNPQYQAAQHLADAIYDPARRAQAEQKAIHIALSDESIIPIARPIHTVVWQSTIAIPSGELVLDTPWYLYGIEQWYLKAQ